MYYFANRTLLAFGPTAYEVSVLAASAWRALGTAATQRARRSGAGDCR